MKNSRMYLQCMGACKYQDKLWFFSGGFNGLFSIDIHDFHVSFEQKLPALDEKTQWAYSGCIHCIYEDKIFFFPYNCKYILNYNVEDKNIQAIPIDTMDGTNTYLTAGIEKYNEDVWVFPSALAQGVFKLNLNTQKLERSNELGKALEGVENIYNFGNIIRLSNSIIVILSGWHSIIGIDLQSKNRVFCKQFEEIDIWAIRYDGNDFWLLLYDSTDVYKWDQKEDKLEKYQLLQEDWINGKGVPYCNMIFMENRIILLPCSLQYIMCIDKEKKTISKAVEYPKAFRFFDALTRWPAFSGYDFIEKYKVLLYPLRGNMLLIYDTERNQIEGKELAVTEEQVPYMSNVIQQKLCQENGILYETDILGIDLLDWIADQNQKNVNSVKKEQIGNKIYDALIRE